MKKIIKVKVNNWEKHQERPGRTNFTWFKFSNRFFEDPKTFNWDAATKVLFVFLMCQASKTGGAEFEVNLNYLRSLLNVTIEELDSSFTILDNDAVIVATYCRQNVDIKPHNAPLEERRVDKKRREEKREEGSNNTSPDGSDRILKESTWMAYAESYQERWKQVPVRNAKINSQIKQLVQRLGSEAPEVTRFFLTLNDGFYLRTLHPLGALLKDCETIRTRLKAGIQITERNRVQQISDSNMALLEKVKRGEL